jgi:hypothetical protein
MGDRPPSQGYYSRRTTQIYVQREQWYMNAPFGIRTHDPTFRVAEDNRRPDVAATNVGNSVKEQLFWYKSMRDNCSQAMSRDGSVGIATRLLAGQPRIRGLIPGRGSVQTCSGAQPASCTMNTGCYFAGGKAAGAWSWPLTFVYCWGHE